MPEIDHTAVDQYWSGVKASILGPYMMDGSGFPASAGHYLDEERLVILLQSLCARLEPGGIILCRESTVRAKTETRDGDYPVNLPVRAGLPADLQTMRANGSAA